MKLNFKKIVPVLTGAILLGSTIGFASSAAAAVSYPTSFSDATVVIGSASNDAAAANDIASDLGKLSASTSLSGENVKIQSSSTNLHVGNALTDVLTTSVDNGDLPSLLKDGTFQAKGDAFDYTQEIKLASGLDYTNVKDDDLSVNPVLGVELADGAAVANYTLSFTKDAESDISSTSHLTDFEDSTIEILGKSYTVLNAYNNTNVKLELMGGAVNDVLEEGAKKDYVINGKTYSVEVTFIGETSVKLIVNGESTTSLSNGDSYKLNDQTEVGVRDILYTAKTGSASKVELTLGAEKLVLENGQTVTMGDNDVDGLTAYIDATYDGTKRAISEIKLVWKTSDKAFIAKDNALEMPGLKSFKIQAGDLTVPMMEDIAIKNNGDSKIALTFPFETGVKTFDLLYANSTKYLGLGKDATHSLVVGTGSSLIFNESANDYFVATFVDETSAESYLLEAKTKTSSDVNYTDIKDVVTGSYFCQDKKADSTCKVGSVVLNIGEINPDANTVNLTVGASTMHFDRIVSKEGLQMSIPTVNTSLGTVTLNFLEESKDNVIAEGGSFNVTVGLNGDGKVQVSSTQPDVSGFQMDDSEKYVMYVESALATKLSLDKNPDQDTLAIEYHGEETIGNVWITAPGVVAGSALVVKDSELTAAQKAGDLVVVGGPAINSVAAELLGLAFPTYGTDAASGFSPGMAQITLFEGKLSPGSVALLVAGYEKDDTSAAAKALIAEHKFGTLKTTSASAYTYA